MAPWMPTELGGLVSTNFAVTMMNCPAYVLADVLVDEPAGWLEPFLRLACAEAEHAAGALALAMRQGPATGRETRAVSVAVGPVVHQRVADVIHVPVHWSVTGSLRLPPAFRGRFELQPIAPAGALVALDGTWHGDELEADASARILQRFAAQTAVTALLTHLRTAFDEATRSAAI